jgi:hypothetical protein
MCLSGRLHPAAVAVIAPRLATPRVVQLSTRVSSYAPLVFHWSIIDRAMRAAAAAPIVGTDRRHGPRDFGPAGLVGGGRTLAANAKVHRGSIVPRLRAGDVSGDARNCCAMEKETRTTQAQAHWPAALEPCDKRSRARPSYRLTQWRARPDAPDPTDELRRNIRPPPSPARLTQ